MTAIRTAILRLTALISGTAHALDWTAPLRFDVDLDGIMQDLDFGRS